MTYTFEKYDVFENMKTCFVEYDWPKGKYAHICLLGNCLMKNFPRGDLSPVYWYSQVFRS